MRRLEHNTSATALATDAATLTLPPGAYATVTGWSERLLGAVPEFELEIWTDTPVAITAAVLYGARLHPFAFADITLTSVTHATNLLTKTGHGLNTGDGPLHFTAGTTYPTGLDSTTEYWFIKIDNDTGKLATSLENALLGTPVDFSTAGSGTLKLIDVELSTNLTQRIAWSTHDGLLGLAGDGAIAVDSGKGYSKRIPHSPRVMAYALVATLDTDTVWASISPIQDR